jgi:tRNA A37 methylthiotransferase MiaB
LRLGEWHALDIENLVEEISSLGKQQKQELRNRLGVLIGHLLKWQFQTELRGKSWRATIREQRDEILDILKENPSLKPYLDEAVQKGFRQGVNLVLRETPLDIDDLPSECPYEIAQILDLQFPFD